MVLYHTLFLIKSKISYQMIITITEEDQCQIFHHKYLPHCVGIHLVPIAHLQLQLQLDMLQVMREGDQDNTEQRHIQPHKTIINNMLVIPLPKFLHWLHQLHQLHHNHLRIGVIWIFSNNQHLFQQNLVNWINLIQNLKKMTNTSLNTIQPNLNSNLHQITTIHKPIIQSLITHKEQMSLFAKVNSLVLALLINCLVLKRYQNYQLQNQTKVLLKICSAANHLHSPQTVLLRNQKLSKIFHLLKVI
mmetsp:Transcript_6538/g.8077  ORF Transcript_6538/g.8077 Transcript_6538/m.8077 type:complete len:246 (-) Transcript_6538:283-1020(-)